MGLEERDADERNRVAGFPSFGVKYPAPVAPAPSAPALRNTLLSGIAALLMSAALLFGGEKTIQPDATVSLDVVTNQVVDQQGAQSIISSADKILGTAGLTSSEYADAAEEVWKIADKQGGLIKATTLYVLRRVLSVTVLDDDGVAYQYVAIAIREIARVAPGLITKEDVASLEQTLAMDGLNSVAYRYLSSACRKLLKTGLIWLSRIH